MQFSKLCRVSDGKHIVMQAPARAGSTFITYKGTHSIVLMAVVNSEYEFILVDIGEAGRQSDGGGFANGHIGYAMNNDLLGLPGPRQISSSLEMKSLLVLQNVTIARKSGNIALAY